MGHICLENSCQYGCRHDEDCGPDELCKNNFCQNPCANDINPCGPNAQCSVVERKAVCSCIEGLVANPTPNIACVRSPSLTCRMHTDCADGWRCEGDRCRPACTVEGSQCLQGERCDLGVCRYACTSDDHCSDDEVCDGRICVTGCRSHTHCPNDLACISGQCVDPCTEPATCGANALCTTKDHRTVCKCPPSLVGNPKVVCRRTSSPCDQNKNCADGFNCYGDTCHPSCRRYNSTLVKHTVKYNVTRYEVWVNMFMFNMFRK